MSDFRILRNGQRVSFTCDNHGYVTNDGKGEQHGSNSSRGSVLNRALVTNPDGETLWLEHVTEKSSASEMYWLMWYDSQGVPSLPASSVFGKDQLANMVSGLAEFVP